MTKRILKHLAVRFSFLGLVLSASLILAQSNPIGLRLGQRGASQPSHPASHQARALLPNSPSYSFSFFDFPQSPNTAGFGINDKFEIVGSYGSTVMQGLGGNGFLLQVQQTGGVTTESFQAVNDPGGGAEQFASGINDSGQIVGGYIDTSFFFHGYELSGGTFTTIAYPGGDNTIPSAINNSGAIVGQWGVGGLQHGFEFSGGVYTSIDFPGALLTGTYGINNSGDIVGFYLDSGNVRHGFLLSGGTYTPIDPPGSVETYAAGINDAGSIVGAYCTTSECLANQDTIQGFQLSKGVYTTVNVPDSTSTIVSGINNTGVIVGSYGECGTGSGLAHAFYAIAVSVR